MIIAFKQYNVYGTSMLKSQVIWHSLKSVNIYGVFCIYSVMSSISNIIGHSLMGTDNSDQC